MLDRLPGGPAPLLRTYTMATVKDMQPSRWAPSIWVIHLGVRGQRLLLEAEDVGRWRIAPGTELDNKALQELRSLSRSARLKEMACRLLSWRPRSRHELKQRLLKAGGDAETVDRVLDELEQQGLIDDASFAAYWVRSRTEFRPRSRRELEAELRSKGVSSQGMKELLDQVPEQELCSAVAIKRAKAFRSLPKSEFRRRLLQYLLRRGFDYDIAATSVEEAWLTLEARSGQQW